MKSLTVISKEVHDNMNNPHKLSEIYVYCSAMYGYYSDLMKEIKISKAERWLKIKESGDEKDISDKKADMLFALTEDGKNEIKYQYVMKAIEKIMSAIKQSLYINNQESKNQY